MSLLLIQFLLLTAPIFAQFGPETAIKNGLERYGKVAVQEKIFVHLDRPLYLVGETLWFKAYQRDGTSHKALDLSKVGYLEILDRQNTPMLQTKFALQEGHGNGSLVLPSTLGSGVYTVRCYSNWMKNFDPGYFFETSITILNPFVPFEPHPVVESPIAYDLQFFPEGGHLVAGLESTVAFRATDTQGSGIAFTGQLIDEQQNVVADFRPSQFGIGAFRFTPQLGVAYSAILTDANGERSQFTFPTVESKGVVMHLKDMGETLEVEVSKHIETATEKLYLMVHTRHGNVQVQSMELTNRNATFVIPKGFLNEGISQITLLDGYRKPLCERLYFTFPKSGLSLEAKVGKGTYGPREKINLDLAASLGNEPMAQADLSVAIYLTDSIQTEDPMDFAAYLLLTSDLRGQVESPSFYFDPNNEGRSQAIDFLMLTHGWRRLDWGQVFAALPPKFDFLPEYQGHFIEGKLVDRTTESPAIQKDLYLAAPDFPARLYTTYSAEDGAVRFEVKDFWGPKELTIQTDLRKDSTYRFELESPFAKNVSAKKLPLFSFDEAWEQTLLNRSINMQARNAYMPAPYRQGKVPQSDTLAFFGRPDERYILDDYTRFPTMEEVLREYVRGVLVRKRQKSFHFKMVDALVPDAIYDSDPLVLLDGIPISSIDKIMAFDPLMIKKVELMNAKYFLGTMAFTGIVSFSTYNHDLSGFELDPNVQVIPYEGLQVAKEFYMPRYDTPAAAAGRIPDLRNLLLWAPNITSDAQGTASVPLYSSDQPGKYRVVVQGVGPDGHAATKSFYFEVKKTVL